MSECEACGLLTDNTDEYTFVCTTNGSMLLCKQCLSDVNRKNPRLTAALEALRLWREWYKRFDYEIGVPMRHSAEAQYHIAATEAVLKE